MFSKQIKLISSSTRLVSRSLSFELPEEIQILQKTCRNYAETKLKPIAHQIDQEARFPAEQIKELGDLGLMGICVNPEYGGSNLNNIAISIAVEELSRACGSTGAIVSIHNCLYANLLNSKGTKEQKDTFLKGFTDGRKIGAFALSEADAGSDVVAMRATATQHGGNWLLNGTKAWVTSGLQAESAIIFATIDKRLNHKGITAFLVNLNEPGISRGPNQRKLGIRGTSTCDLILENLEVPEKNVLGEVGEGFRIAMEQLDQARIGIASQAIGIAQAALDLAISYANQRKAFDRTLLSMPTIQTKLAEMALKIEASRLLVWQAATFRDQGKKSTKFTSLAKWHSGECANFCTATCLQILGGVGYTQDYPAERYYRDSRITEIYGGTTDIQKLVVAENLIKEYGF